MCRDARARGRGPGVSASVHSAAEFSARDSNQEGTPVSGLQDERPS